MELIPFYDLNEKEKNMVLKWRNSPEVSKYMNTKEISLKEHSQFIESLKNNLQKHYFLAKEHNKYIGVIYLNGNEIGLYKNPDLKHVGSKLLNELLRIGFEKYDTLYLEVFNFNTKAINLYKKFGFKTLKESDGKTVMSLKKFDKIPKN
ncbi:MAG: UDP-4-amino-4,6-dideoxy-N-acetyl-beta-L-altrosamine N-acetyltransferase [Epsilonproteobacteria bacterium]|nr:UDP-4-amino-4,6-dideoxy-N-acetyl-beta-L-altrosamine N-acetyltransferase [Campylobacterota bacterium]